MSICSDCYHDPLRGSCCRRRVGEAPFPLFREDVSSISEHVGRDPSDLFDIHYFNDAEVKLLRETSSLWDYALPSDRQGYILSTRMDGTCKFLKDGFGCTLGEARPSICKMYPFFFKTHADGEDRLDLTYGPDCPAAIESKQDPIATCETLGQSIKEIQEVAGRVLTTLYGGG